MVSEHSGDALPLVTQKSTVERQPTKAPRIPLRHEEGDSLFTNMANVKGNCTIAIQRPQDHICDDHLGTLHSYLMPCDLIQQSADHPKLIVSPHHSFNPDPLISPRDDSSILISNLIAKHSEISSFPNVVQRSTEISASLNLPKKAHLPQNQSSSLPPISFTLYSFTSPSMS